MEGLYSIVVVLLGMYVYVSWHLIKLSCENDDLRKENKHLEKRIDNLMECVRMLNKGINKM